MTTTSARPRRLGRIVPYWIFAVLLAFFAVWVALRAAERTAAARQCEHSVTVEVSDELVDTVQRSAARLHDVRDPRDCTSYEVLSASRRAAAEAPVPDLWVPDSTIVAAPELQDARHAVVTWTQLGVIAESPVVFVAASGSAPTREAPSWRAIVEGGLPTRMVQPDESRSSLLALVAGRTVVGDNVAAQKAFGGALIALGQTAVDTEDALFALARDGSGAATVFPVSEQRLLAELRSSPSADLAAVVLKEGAPFLDYPLLVNERATEADRVAAQALLADLRSEAGKADLIAAHLRTPGGPAPEGGVASVTRLPVKVEDAIRAMRSWQAVTVPMRTLAIIDISGSMATKHAGRSRIDQTVEASTTALSLFPDSAQVGLWEFSTSLKGNQDWRELVPIARLTQATGAATQRTLLQNSLQALPTHLTGDTGLYDTVLAAYLRVEQGYDPGAVNSIILLTDGTNDDPRGGITLPQLLARLQAEADSSAPIRIVTIGIGDDADMSALTQISKATGGNAFHARDPQQIRDMYVEALFDRFCRPRCT